MVLRVCLKKTLTDDHATKNKRRFFREFNFHIILLSDMFLKDETLSTSFRTLKIALQILVHTHSGTKNKRTDKQTVQFISIPMPFYFNYDKYHNTISIGSTSAISTIPCLHLIGTDISRFRLRVSNQPIILKCLSTTKTELMKSTVFRTICRWKRTCIFAITI